MTCQTHGCGGDVVCYCESDGVILVLCADCGVVAITMGERIHNLPQK
jgi:hypothetical protein